MFEMMSLEDGLLVQNTAMLGGFTAMAADSTWPAVLLGIAAVVMLIVSARKGVRAFDSIALSYSNSLWLVLGKRGQVTLRVHSFTSTTGSNCYVKASGKFTTELLKGDGDNDGKETRSDRSKHNFSKCPGAAKAGCILGTEMVFIYGTSSSVFQTRGKMAASSAGKRFRAGLLPRPLDADALGELGTKSRSFLARVPAESKVRHSGVQRVGREESEEDCYGGGKSMVEECTSSHIEPFQLVKFEVPAVTLSRRNVWPPMGDYPWDVDMNLRLEGQSRGTNLPSREQGSSYASAVVRGPNQTATLSKNVVKIWDNSTRRTVLSLSSQPGHSVSSLDVDWERETAFLGTSDGVLSVWDFERATCVSSIGSHCGVQYSIAAANSLNDSWMWTAGRLLNEECRVISLRDSRVRRGGAAVMATFSNSAPFHDVKFDGFGLVVRDRLKGISTQDIRMLRPSPVSSELPAEFSPVRTRISSDKIRLDENWWDVGVADLLLQEEDDFCEDAWGRVENGMGNTKASVFAPGMISRCFHVLSSALAR